MIAALAVIAAVGGSLWIKSRDEAAPAPQAVAVATPRAAPIVPASAPPISAATRAFLAFARADPPAELPLDHGYTAAGLRHLAAAVAVAGESALWRDRARRLEAAAAELEKDAESLQHADIAREAFIDAAGWLEADRARAAAEALRVDEPLRSQSQEVAAYFRLAAQSLEERHG